MTCHVRAAHGPRGLLCSGRAIQRDLTSLAARNTISSLLKRLDAAAGTLNFAVVLRLLVLSLRSLSHGAGSLLQVRGGLILLVIPSSLLLVALSLLGVEVARLELQPQLASATGAHRAVAGGANLLCAGLADGGVQIRGRDQGIVALLQRFDPELDLGVRLVDVGLAVRTRLVVGRVLAVQPVDPREAARLGAVHPCDAASAALAAVE